MYIYVCVKFILKNRHLVNKYINIILSLHIIFEEIIVSSTVNKLPFTFVTTPYLRGQSTEKNATNNFVLKSVTQIISRLTILKNRIKVSSTY